MGLRDRNMGDSGVGMVVAGVRWRNTQAKGVKSAGRAMWNARRCRGKGQGRMKKQFAT